VDPSVKSPVSVDLARPAKRDTAGKDIIHRSGNDTAAGDACPENQRLSSRVHDTAIDRHTVSARTHIQKRPLVRSEVSIRKRSEPCRLYSDARATGQIGEGTANDAASIQLSARHQGQAIRCMNRGEAVGGIERRDRLQLLRSRGVNRQGRAVHGQFAGELRLQHIERQRCGGGDSRRVPEPGIKCSGAGESPAIDHERGILPGLSRERPAIPQGERTVEVDLELRGRHARACAVDDQVTFAGIQQIASNRHSVHRAADATPFSHQLIQHPNY
jgi:hypothetical protein